MKNKQINNAVEEAMIGKIYLVYIERGEGYCGAYAFVYDKKLNDFNRISSHMSSTLAWAAYDIRRHDEDYRKVFPDGYEFVDVGVFKKSFGDVDYSDVMDAISKAHDQMEGAVRE